MARSHKRKQPDCVPMKFLSAEAMLIEAVDDGNRLKRGLMLHLDAGRGGADDAVSIFLSPKCARDLLDQVQDVVDDLEDADEEGELDEDDLDPDDDE